MVLSATDASETHLLVNSRKDNYYEINKVHVVNGSAGVFFASRCSSE